MKTGTTIFFLIFIFCEIRAQEGAVNFAEASQFQLAAPQVKSGPVLFRENSTLELDLGYPGVSIFYSDDGSEVTLESKKYTGPIVINKSVMVRGKAMHPDFLESETVSQQFFKIGHEVSGASVSVTPSASENYPGKGAASLVDLEKGNTNFRQGKQWLGFQADTVQLELKLPEVLPIDSVTASLLQDNGSWIFLPAKIQVFANGKLLAERKLEPPKSMQSTEFQFLTLSFEEIAAHEFLIKIISLPAIPAWHPGAGSVPWLFIDEVLLN